MKNTLRKAFIDTLPIMSGYIVMGMAFGILLKNAGYGIAWAFIISVFVYAGSMQYILITLLTGGVSLISVALTTLTVNARHLFYGLSMIEKYENTGKIKPYLIFSLTDETYSLVCNNNSDKGKKYYFSVSILNHIYWITGSVIGSILGEVASFNMNGIEFAMTALFIVVVVEQWLSTKKHIPTIIGFVCSIICLLIFGAQGFLIPAMISILIAISIMQKKRGIMHD